MAQMFDMRTSFGVPTTTPIQLDRFLPYIIHKLWASISIARSLPLQGDNELRTREWRVLMVIGAFGPMTGAEIAEKTSMDTGSTARAVKSLLETNMLMARTPKADRRKQVLALTPKGVAAHDDVAVVRTRFCDDALSCLTPDEQNQLFTLLRRLQTHVNDMQRDEQGWIEDTA